MSHTIESRKQIPDAPFYVLSNDKFMSGWGQAKDKTNTIILPCASYEQAQIVEQNCHDRSEQKNVRIVSNKPTLRAHVVYSLLTEETSPLWYSPARPFGKVSRG